MATLQSFASTHYKSESANTSKEYVFGRDCLVEMALSLFYISLGAISAGVLLLAAWETKANILGAASFAAASLYFANLSESKNVKDFLAMTIPGTAIIVLLLWDVSNPLLVGFSLVIHLATSFYSTVSKHNGTIDELNLWPSILGFHITLVGYWIFTL